MKEKAWSIGGMMINREKSNVKRKACNSTTLSTINSTQTGVGVNADSQ
jgi:hypothetical protein